MTCFHPLYKFDVGNKTENGKRDLYWIRNPNQSIADLKRIYGRGLVPIPCGKCLGCQLDYSRDWSVRCILEASRYQRNCFLTLTFDKEHVPERVSKDDLSNFMKRLRNMFPKANIRFFGCGEYGEIFSRPHYHVIIFNFDFADKKRFNKTLFTSEDLNKLWPYGYATIGEVSQASCGYVARYCMKKRSKESLYGDEFVLMSRRPGIGEFYFIEHPDMFDTDFVYGNFGKRFKASIPRYYKKLAEKYGLCIDEFNDRAIERANNFEMLDLNMHGMNDFEMLHTFNESMLTNKIKFLKRSLS